MKKRLGLVGTGFIAAHFFDAVSQASDVEVTRILTRRDLRSFSQSPYGDRVTLSVDELIDHADLIVESSGDVLHATDVISQALRAGKPVVTMNAEFHVTTGSYFAGKGVLTEAEGDQPGCLAAMHENVTAMGFKPVVYGNVKGYYHPDPSEADMRTWSKKQGISLAMVTAATDGTKMQYEQALVANQFQTALIQEGMLGLAVQDLEKDAFGLLEHVHKLNAPVTDYVVQGSTPVRVFIIAQGDPRQQPALEYLKMGPGPYYFFQNRSILCHLEILKTVRRIFQGGDTLLNNSPVPLYSVAAVAKHRLPKDHMIHHALGNFDVRGTTVRINERLDHVPMALLAGAVFKRSVEPGEIVRWADVNVPPSLALTAWNNICNRSLA